MFAITTTPLLVWAFVGYFGLTLLVGWLSRRREGESNDFLNASRSLPLPVVVAAYLAANCGALEIVGLSAMASQYGVEAFNFYWIGAIPAMVFLSLFMMPVYRKSGVRSVPEYLEKRYGPSTRLLNAASTAVLLLLLSGVGLYAMGQVLQVILGVSFLGSVTACAVVVMAYVLIGGVRATIANEVLQLIIMLAGLLPLAWRSARHSTPEQLAYQGTRAHLWLSLHVFDPHARTDLVGITFGLGFVLSFGYWCTDFVMMQRAFMTRTESAARQVPLWAGFGKLLFSLIVVLPGLLAFRCLPGLGHGERYDQALPALMKQLYSPRMLALGLTALAASLMSGFAGNVAAFASVWTEDIYRATLRPGLPEKHYLSVARCAIVSAVLLSALASWLNFLFADIMEHVQLIFSVLGAPFFAVFLLGMLSRRVSERGALCGVLAGAGVSFVHSLAVMRGFLHYGSTMTADFYAAGYAFGIATIVSLVWRSPQQVSHSDHSAVIRWDVFKMDRTNLMLCALSAILLTVCAALNYIWR